MFIPLKSSNFAPAKMSRGSSLRVCMLIPPQILYNFNMANSQVCRIITYYYVIFIFIRIGI